jgi:hypothetical protein
MMARMRRLPSPIVRRRGAEGLLLGHIAMGSGVAGAVQQRGTEGALSWTATVLGSGEPVHGANDAGVVCAALDRGGHVLVRWLLERADSVAAAAALLAGGVPNQDPLPRVILLVADAGGVMVADLTGEGEPEIEPLAPEPGEPELSNAIPTLRGREPAPEEGRVPAAGLVAVLERGRPPELYLALGPPCCGVFIRHWPGIELVPDETATPEGAPLARLAAAVADATTAQPDLRAAARARLDRAEAEALAEGEAAERMAARMDADTDDRGAAVRRLVAQAHAAELARAALEEVAVPGRAYNRPRS